MVDAGAPDHTTAAEPSWSLTIALAAVIVVALLAGVLALADGGSGGRVDAADQGPASTATTSVVASTTTSSATAATTTTSSATATTTTTLPPIEPVLIPPETIVAPWAADGFTVAFPTEPRVGSVPVRTSSGTVTRSEYDLDGPDGSVLSVTVVEFASTGQSSAAVLADVAAQVGRDLGASPVVEASTTVGGQPALPFRVATLDGGVRAVVIHGPGRLYTVSMFTPGHGPSDAADAVFDQLVASFRLV